MSTPQPVAYRIRAMIDPDAQFEECNGEPRPLTEEEYAENQYFTNDGATLVPYADYLEYQGNPDRHIYLMTEVETQCGCCGEWKRQGGTGFIDFMDDSPEIGYEGQWFSPEALQANKANLGYLADVMYADLAEAGCPVPA